MQSYSTLKSKGTTATISGLKPATRYIFQVRARTSAGCGRFSQSVEVETGKPGEPCTVRRGVWGWQLGGADAFLHGRGSSATQGLAHISQGFSLEDLLGAALLRCAYT